MQNSVQAGFGALSQQQSDTMAGSPAASKELSGAKVERWVWAQVFTLFKSSRTHMMLACCLKEPAPELPAGPQGVLSVRSQQNFLSKYMKQVTGVITLEDGECSTSWSCMAFASPSTVKCEQGSVE